MNKQHIGRIGLNNNGNTCYLNSTLQLLSHSGFFVHKMFSIIFSGMKNEHKGLNDMENNKQYKKFNNIEKNMFNFFIEKWISTNKVYDPYNIQKSIAEKNDMFNPKNGIQNDSSESMVIVLDLITHKPLQEIFNNKFNSKRQCMKCMNYFERIEVFNILSLDMSSSIKDSFDLFCKTEDMDGQVYCKYCKSKQDYQKTYEVDTISDNLIIHMKRFECINYKNYVKNNNPIDIQDIMKIHNNHFELRGIILHSGRREGGHYTFVGKNLNNEWSMYDDRNCYPITVNLKNYSKTAYILLYEKIKN